MKSFTTIEKEDIKKRITDKKRLAKRDGHEDGYWFSMLDSLCEDLINSLKMHQEIEVGDIATKEYVERAIRASKVME